MQSARNVTKQDTSTRYALHVQPTKPFVKVFNITKNSSEQLNTGNYNTLRYTECKTQNTEMNNVPPVADLASETPDQINLPSVRTHTGKVFPLCTLCKKAFSSKEALIDHMVVHGQCSACNEMFVRSGDLNQHLKICHTEQKIHLRNICENFFSSGRDLSRHVLIHTKEKSHQCTICNKSFARKGYLHQHFLLHSKKPHQCNVCSKAFLKKVELQTHLLSHTGEKPFQCKVCDKRFARKAVLNRHLLLHEEKKGFQCTICGKAFRWKDDMKKHSWIQSDHKPFQCNVCDKGFIERKS